jgi:N-acetyl sugar amidotransferase
MKICKKCIQPDTRPGVFFNEDGICGACIWQDEMSRINWKQRENELQEIASWAKKTSNSNYDCVIGVSGGKDSTKQALTAKDKLGLRCLLVNSEPVGLTEIGRNNIENLKNLGFDVISLRPNPKIMKKLIKRDFFKYLNPVKITEYSLWASTYIIAEKFEIPLIIQGENPGLTLGASNTGVGTDSNALKANELHTISNDWKEYLDVTDVEQEDLYFFHYNREKLEKNQVRAIWLNYFLKEWSNHNNAIFSKEHGLQWRPDNFNHESIGTYLPYFQLDTDLTQVNQLLKFIKFGFGQTMDHACYDFRENRISRKEATDLVLKLDGKCSNDYIKKFCEYIGITNDEFWNTTEKFRGTMWKKDTSGKWENEIWKLLSNIKNENI